jgi:hypothetical protein
VVRVVVPQGKPRRFWERAVLLEAVAVVAVLLITGILALLFVVVLRSRLRRFVMRLEAWKFRFVVEVDSSPEADKHPEGRHRALPDSKSTTRSAGTP